MRQEYLSDIARMRQEMQDTLMIGITCHNDSSILNSVAIAGHAFFKYVSAGRLRPKSTGCKKADKTGLEGMIVII
jgi:thiamine monophosphate synthase